MQALGAQPLQAFQGMARRKQLEHFVEQARGRHVFDQAGQFADWLLRLGGDGKIQLGGETHGAQHAHRVFPVTGGWATDHAQGLVAEIGESLVVIDHRLRYRVVVQGVDREVAPRGIFLLRAENIVAQHAPLLVGLRAMSFLLAVMTSEGGHFDGLLAHHHVHDLKAPADNARATEALAYLLGCGVGRYVEVLGLDAGQQVAHGAADDKGLIAVLLQGFHRAPAAAADRIAGDAVLGVGNHAGLAVAARGRAAEDAGNEFADH